jgi:hypothetical protein
MNPVRRLFRGCCAGPLVVALAWSAGCATGEKLTLDATSRPAREPVTSYSLVVADPGIEENTLRHQEAVRLVKAALAGNGYFESPDPARADMAITIDYEIGPARTETWETSMPVYRGDSRSHTESVPTGRLGADGHEIYSTVTVQDPPEQVYVGEQMRTVRKVIHDKNLVLQARKRRPAAPGEAPEDLWVMEVISTGPSADLRKTLPVLAAVALEHLGKETDGPKAIRMTDEEAIAFVQDPANAR